MTMAMSLARQQKAVLDLRVSYLPSGHANLPCIVPILTGDPRRQSEVWPELAKAILSLAMGMDMAMARQLIFMISLVHWKSLMNFIYVIHLVHCNHLTDLIAHSRNNRSSRSRGQPKSARPEFDRASL